MATPQPPNGTPPDKDNSPHGTNPWQQGIIRLVFLHEFGITNVQSINVESTVLYNALSTKRHADIDGEDDGSLHSEVLKNAIDLLQRFHRCAPLYPKKDAAGHRQRKNNFFAKEVYCRVFCSDIEGFDNKENPRAWIDVFHFFHAMKKIWDGSLLGGLRTSVQDMVAAGFDARGEVAKAKTRSRKGAVLWELMGLTSKAIDRTGHTKPEEWCVEAVITVGMWRKRLKGNKDSLFRLPVEDDWGTRSDDVLPDRDEDAMKLFQELETKFRAFYNKCHEQMPGQATLLPEIPKKLPTPAATPEAYRNDDFRDQNGVVEIIQRDGTSDETSTSGESTSKERAPRVNVHFLPRKVVQHDFTTAKSTGAGSSTSEERIFKKNAPRVFGRDFVTQVILHQDFMPHPLKQAYHHWALTHRAFDRATLNRISTTEDTWQFSAPKDPTHKALEQAKMLITNVLHASGLEPNWNPDGPLQNAG